MKALYLALFGVVLASARVARVGRRQVLGGVNYAQDAYNLAAATQSQTGSQTAYSNVIASPYGAYGLGAIPYAGYGVAGYPYAGYGGLYGYPIGPTTATNYQSTNYAKQEALASQQTSSTAYNSALGPLGASGTNYASSNTNDLAYSLNEAGDTTAYNSYTDGLGNSAVDYANQNFANTAGLQQSNGDSTVYNDAYVPTLGYGYPGLGYAYPGLGYGLY